MEREAAGETPSNGSALAALRAEIAAAFGGLTILPVGVATRRPGREALFYPLVGLAIGGVLWAFDAALRLVLSQELTSVLLVAGLAVLSGGRHLDGFGNTADGLIGVRDREDALAAMHDRRVGTFGTAAIVFLLVLKIRCFDLLADDARLFAILVAPTLGRWAMVVLAHGAREAAPGDEAQKFARALGSREFGMASVIAFAVTLSVAEAGGLVILIAAASAAVGLRLYLHRRLGGITEQSLGAVSETVETLALMLFAFG